MENVKVTKKKYSHFIGIDVSKNTLDYAVLCGKNLLFHEVRQNDPVDIVAFVAKLEILPKFTVKKALFCLEHTGFYVNHLLNVLKDFNANIVLESGLQIKNSLGVIRDKSDKIDAIRIAHYAQKNRDELELWKAKRGVVLQLKHLNTLRDRLLRVATALKTPLKEQRTFNTSAFNYKSKEACGKSIHAIQNDLKTIDGNIAILIKNDKLVNRLQQLITSVPGVGPVTAIQIIICTNEFKDIKDPKKFACYAGVAPFIKESGLFKGKAKVSHIANKKMKSLLHLCALNAVRRDDEIKTYYERKTIKEGKQKSLVINAVRYKLILRIFACVKQDRCYQKEYNRLGAEKINELNTCIEPSNNGSAIIGLRPVLNRQ